MRRSTPLLFSLLICLLLPSLVFAQIEEPELRPFDPPRTPADDGVSNGIGLNVVLNNFGAGVGAEYKRVVAPFMEAYTTFRITGLRDVGEQTFTDFFFGQQIVPNKYQRGFSMPLTFGVRQRMLANTISDDYRFYLVGGIGPVLAFTYPYFEDQNENGFREDLREFGIGYVEPVNDIFTGLSDGDWHLGLAGELKLSLDIGRNFANLTSIQFGYMFYYFDEGLQIMQPQRPKVRDDFIGPGELPYVIDPETGWFEMEPWFDAQRFFGTPQISFVFGRMW